MTRRRPGMPAAAPAWAAAALGAAWVALAWALHGAGQASAAGKPGELAAVVVRVIDGDTFVARLAGAGLAAREETVRLIGVDTPETVHPTLGVEPFGPQASEFTRQLLRPGTPVRLELDVQQRDRYGRLLAYVYLPDGRMLNAELLKAGLAQVYTVPPNVRYAEEFLRWQRQARQARAGLWGEPAAGSGRGVRIQRVDVWQEEVELVNGGAGPVDLAGWVLISVAGNQRFRFPPGLVLQPGGRLVVRSGPGAAAGPGVLVWSRRYVWNNQGDSAELRDAAGALVARWPEDG